MLVPTSVQVIELLSISGKSTPDARNDPLSSMQVIRDVVIAESGTKTPLGLGNDRPLSGVPRR